MGLVIIYMRCFNFKKILTTYKVVHLSAFLSRTISKFENVLLEDAREVIVPKFSIQVYCIVKFITKLSYEKDKTHCHLILSRTFQL